jgi:hypothetical protein
MEIKIIHESTISPSLVPARPSSIFESDPLSFSRWLSGSPSDSLKSRWRADMPQPFRASHGSSQESSLQECSFPERASLLSSSPSSPSAGSIEEICFSHFGHCVPLVATHVESNAINEKQEIIGRERLVRLLAAQQAWYDAQKEACAIASATLELIEHHQTQWLQANSIEM